MEADPSASLAIVIEFSVGLAGFSGVAAVFRSTGQWQATERFRVGNLLSSSLLSGFLAFLALGLYHLRPDSAWRIASGVFGVMGVLAIARTLTVLRRLAADPNARISRGLGAFLSAGSAVNALCQLANAWGVFGEDAFVVLYAGLVWQLLLASTQFVRLIFAPSQE